MCPGQPGAGGARHSVARALMRAGHCNGAGHRFEGIVIAGLSRSAASRAREARLFSAFEVLVVRRAAVFPVGSGAHLLFRQAELLHQHAPHRGHFGRFGGGPRIPFACG